METAIIRKIGNSKGIILPKKIIDKYHFCDLVIINEGEDGITIKPVKRKSLFREKLEKASAHKTQLYKTMEQEANNENTIAYYKNQIEEIGNIDLNIIEE